MSPYDRSNISHTTVTDFDRVHVENLMVSMLLVEVSANQLQEQLSNVSLDIERERGVIPYHVTPPLPFLLNISRLLITQYIGVTTL